MHAELAFFASTRQEASAGVLSEKHWINESLKSFSSTEWIQLKTLAGASKKQGEWQWTLSRSRLGYLSANRNALHLAAQDESRDQVDISTQGVFSLHAKVHSLSSTVIAVSKLHRLNERVSIEVTPHLHHIHDYQRSEAYLNLQTQGTQSRLTGHLTRVGTRNYGFLINDRPDSGFGWGVDAKILMEYDWGKIRWDAANLLGRLHFKSVHESSRQYDVVAADGKDIVVSEIPSIQGTYGVTSRKEKLPVVWRFGVSPSQIRGLDVGLIALGSDARWTVGYGLQIKNQHRIWAQTVEAVNWSVGWDASITSRWNAGVAMTGVRSGGGPVLSSLYVRGVW